jgi:hypothetical protein
VLTLLVLPVLFSYRTARRAESADEAGSEEVVTGRRLSAVPGEGE